MRFSLKEVVLKSYWNSRQQNGGMDFWDYTL